MANNVTKTYHEDGGDEYVIDSGGKLNVRTGGVIAAGGTQAAAITDALTGGSATAADCASRINLVLAALRGVGIIASS